MSHDRAVKFNFITKYSGDFFNTFIVCVYNTI